MNFVQMFNMILFIVLGAFLLLLGCQGEPENIIVECPEIETPKSSEPEILDISLDSFEFLVNDSLEEGHVAFRELQRKYERRPIRFTGTVRHIFNALQITEDPGDFTHVIYFVESGISFESHFYLPKTIDLLFTEGDKITVTGEYEAISLCYPITTTFYISDVEFKRE